MWKNVFIYYPFIHGCESTIPLLYKFFCYLCYFALVWQPLKQFSLQFRCWTGHSKMLLFPSVKCTQYHIVEVISPRMLFFSLHFSLWNIHNQKHTHAHTLYMRAYVLYLSLCWAYTLLCLTCFLCHDDERHLLFSAETPLHPMLLTSCLHYSQVEWLLSHFSERLNFCDMGWSEMQDSRVGSVTSGNLSQSQEDCGGFYSHFVLTLWNVNIILPVHFQISLLLQTAGNNFFSFFATCNLIIFLCCMAEITAPNVNQPASVQDLLLVVYLCHISLSKNVQRCFSIQVTMGFNLILKMNNQHKQWTALINVNACVCVHAVM